MPFFDLFALDMQRVLNEEIVETFAGLDPVPLTSQNLNMLAEHEARNPQATKGLYILHYRGVAVYVGKADDSVRLRLEDHRAKLACRRNMDVADIGFRCLYLDKNWSALTHERPLIERFGLLWNASGFGNHDPGRNRDRTVLKPTHFDRLYPIDADLPLRLARGKRLVYAALLDVRAQLPFLFRFQTAKRFRPARSHPDYYENSVRLNAVESARTAMGKIVDALGGAWQATFLYGYLILYREHYDYDSKSAILFKRGNLEWVAPAGGDANEAADTDAEDE